ncbi:flagellar motor control protein ZomB [Rhodococcus spongiicola]|uniref:flagellar motor control protein ZomB n=1 Tax=Rhodococcus spongiicola TaxID=2487352 RepID=UPI0026A7BB7E
MSLSTWSDPTRTIDERIVEPRPRGARISGAVFVGGVVLTALLFAWGTWQRRWIADDGLIVLRTVRNLLAGNGPVFNAGERVETNTSTLWTYLVYAFSWLTQARLEYVVLGLALVLSVSAVVMTMIGTARLYRARFGGGAVLLLPAGAIVYIAVPPARDFATSGLETCLVIFWIALLWLLLVRWAQTPAPSWRSVLLLAFVAGLGPLVRPEMAIVGGLALLLIFFSPISWKLRAWIVAAAGVVPVAYQIWRMGYYGLPYPNTAVSKDAGGAKWSQGLAYLWNLVGPYLLWLPLLTVAVIVAMAWWRKSPRPTPNPMSDVDHSGGSAWGRFSRRLHTPAGIVVFILACGLILAIYSIRVGGDFMHGRVLLPSLFCLLVPISVVPVRILRRSEWGRNNATLVFGVSTVAWTATMGWAVIAANTVGMPDGAVVGKSGIVDERAFYSLNTGRQHPIRAEDYLDYPRMRAMVETIADTPDGGLLLPTPAFTSWDIVPPPLPIPEGGVGHTVYFLNLGMTSMNVGLDVKVLDQMGLAYPIAAHTERLDGGRIGHDKVLYPDWVVADTGMVPVHPWLPWYLDEKWVRQAQVALTCPETVELKESYRAELTWPLFERNLLNAFEYAGYRFDRVPKYEIQRCDLEMPEAPAGR